MTTTSKQRSTAGQARSEQPAAAESWLHDRIRTGDDGSARLQVKLGNMHCSF